MSRSLAARLGDPDADEHAFTQDCADVAYEALHTPAVTVIGPLQLELTLGGFHKAVDLHESWRAASQDRPRVVWDQLRSLQSAVDEMENRFEGTVEEIVPLVRSEAEAAAPRAAFHQLADPLTPELCVLYAFNHRDRLDPFVEQDLDRLGLERSRLRDIALRNLRRLTASPVKKVDQGVWTFVVPAGAGILEPSLLLQDELWDALAKQLRGDVVVAVPTRDLILASSSRSSAAIVKLRALAADAFVHGDHPLSGQLLVRRGDTWQPLEPP